MRDLFASRSRYFRLVRLPSESGRGPDKLLPLSPLLPKSMLLSHVKEDSHEGIVPC